jgi:hypothetical protein
MFLTKTNQPTIRQFQEHAALAVDDNQRGIDRELRFAAIMRNMTVQEAEEKISLDEIMEINRRYKMPTAGEEVTSIPRTIWIRGRLFRLFPDFTRLTFGEFAAFEHFTRTPKTSTREMHNIVALLTREIRPPYLRARGRKEPAEVYLERAAFLQDNAPAQLATSISAFFLRVWTELCDPTHNKTAGERYHKATRTKNTTRRP